MSHETDYFSLLFMFSVNDVQGRLHQLFINSNTAVAMDTILFLITFRWTALLHFAKLIS